MSRGSGEDDEWEKLKEIRENVDKNGDGNLDDDGRAYKSKYSAVVTVADAPWRPLRYARAPKGASRPQLCKGCAARRGTPSSEGRLRIRAMSVMSVALTSWRASASTIAGHATTACVRSVTLMTT